MGEWSKILGDNMNETYEQIIEFIWQQREIEFVYKDKPYAFLSSKDGFIFVCENKTQGPVFEKYDQMVNESEIDGRTFLELFKNGEIIITAVM